MKLKSLAAPKSSFATTVAQEDRRLTGVTPKLLGNFKASPARYLKRSKSLRALGAGKKVSMKGQL